MDPNTFTLKTQAALEAARQQAAARDQQAIEPEHVLLALLADPEGVVFPLLHTLGRLSAHAAGPGRRRRSTGCRRCTRSPADADTAVRGDRGRCSTARGPRRRR